VEQFIGLYTCAQAWHILQEGHLVTMILKSVCPATPTSERRLLFPGNRTSHALPTRWWRFVQEPGSPTN
jgi:hypothetical protein